MFQIFFRAIIYLLFCTSLYSQTNLFTDAANNNDWNTPANWSLGIAPTISHNVTIAAGKKVSVKNTTSAMAKSITYGSSDTLFITDNASLTIDSILLISGTGFLKNNGRVEFSAGCRGLKISTGADVENNDSIIINSPLIGIDFSQGSLYNNGLIVINNPQEQGLFMYQSASFPNQRHFYNTLSGRLNITGAHGYGIYLADSLTNFGTITVENTVRDHVNVPTNGIYVYSIGYLNNFNKIAIDGTEDYGLDNDGWIYNRATGDISFPDFDDYGLKNNGYFDNFGNLNFTGLRSFINNAAIYNESNLNNKNGGIITIDGNDILDYGIHNLYPMDNDSNAIITISAIIEAGIKEDGGFTNRGSITVFDISDALTYGIESYHTFHNHGTIYMHDMGSGYNVQSGTLINYKNMIFQNLTSKSIFAQSSVLNNVGANILAYNNNGTRMSSGIVYVDDCPSGGCDFMNHGNITLDSCNLALDLRLGEFSNTGNIFINHYRAAIDFGNFGTPAILNNSSNLYIRNHEEPLLHSITLEGGIVGSPNFINTTTGYVELLNIHRGFIVKSGLRNLGVMKFTNVNENCFLINNTTQAHQVINETTGVIDIKNCGRAVYFGESSTLSNQISFLNNSLFKFDMMSDTAIAGKISAGKFDNTDTIVGNGILDCSFALPKGKLSPGFSIGKITLANYQAPVNPMFIFELKGDIGAGLPNGNDLIHIPQSFTLPSTLNVIALPEFIPVIGSEYTILTCDGSISGNFNAYNLPDFGNTYELRVIKSTNNIKLKVYYKNHYWTGTTDTNWNNASNWSNNIVPDHTMKAVVYGGVPRYPLINTGSFSIGSNKGVFKCAQLDIDYNAEVNIAGIEVLISSLLNVRGTLNCNGCLGVYTSSAGEIKIETLGQVKIKN